MVALEGPPPQKACRGYKRPHAPLNQKKKGDYLGFCSLPRCLLHIFSKHKKHTKNLLKPLDSPFFIKNIRYCSYIQSSFPWFYTLDLGFRGVDVAF